MMTKTPRSSSLSETQAQQISWATLDRLDWHLWLLASLLILVLGASLLSFMFPSAFWLERDLPVRAPQRAFIGFCVLLALVLVYLLQKQATVRQLKRALFEAQTDLATAEWAATIHFQSNITPALRRKTGSRKGAKAQRKRRPHWIPECRGFLPGFLSS